MKVLAVSDVESEYIWDYFDRSRFSGVELILSCGDLHRDYLEFLCSMIPAPLLYVPGNHDKRFLTKPPEGCECIHGRMFVHNGLRVLGFGGCKSNNPCTYEYTETQMRKMVGSVRRAIERAGGFDVLVTHAPAKDLGDGKDAFHQGFEVFRELLSTYTPRLHLFGHQHKGYARPENVHAFGGVRLQNAYGYHILEI